MYLVGLYYASLSIIFLSVPNYLHHFFLYWFVLEDVGNPRRKLMYLIRFILNRKCVRQHVPH